DRHRRKERPRHHRDPRAFRGPQRSGPGQRRCADRGVSRVRPGPGRRGGGLLGRRRGVLRWLGSEICSEPRRSGAPARRSRLPGPRRRRAAWADGPLAPRTHEASHRSGGRPRGRGWNGTGAVVRPEGHGRGRLFRRLLPALGHPAPRRRHGAAAAARRAGQGAGHHPDRPQGRGRGSVSDRALRAHRAQGPGPRGRRGAGPRDRPLPAGMRARRPPIGSAAAWLAGRRGAAARMGHLGPCDRERGRAGRRPLFGRQGAPRGFCEAL
ncbi:MAG: Enoyl-CoA hydratase @ Enoyl-CoA hydratase EchA5, partial [uncultured Microvirga sp.]